MCIDYTGLNKCCPKDYFALPRIDQVVDSTAGSELLCFLDAYSGYHQIKMRESDQLKTAFTTTYGTFCYITMPFGLKNAGATYQRCMQRCLNEQIGRNVHVYVDDMSRKKADFLEDLRETFDNLRTYRMKLNPRKCVFGVPTGKLLGFIVSERGIEVNPKKIKAILNITRPTCLKDVQRLAGSAATVSPPRREGNASLPAIEEIRQLRVDSRGRPPYNNLRRASYPLRYWQHLDHRNQCCCMWRQPILPSAQSWSWNARRKTQT